MSSSVTKNRSQTTVDDAKRRERLEQVLGPLLEVDDFSIDEAKLICLEAKPAYVTRTVKELANDGRLMRFEVSGVLRFRWLNSNQFDLSDWISNQIHGLQVKETPEPLRPRERLIQHGAASLNLADLLAILIRVGVRNESAIAGGQRIVNRLGDRLDDIPHLTPAELKEMSPAATVSSYAQIMAGIELGRRIAVMQEDRLLDSMQITSTALAIEYCQKQFRRLASDGVQEEFHVVTLDTKHKPIRNHKVTVGTLDASLVHPREVFHPAIRDSASAVLLIHNHPSGDPTPSREDFQVTDRLTEAGKILGITVLDHIVVARQCCVSIREER